MTILTVVTGTDVNIRGEKIQIIHLLVGGWAAFFLSLILSFIFYSVHPSQVDVLTVKEKLKVNICGYKLYLSGSSRQRQYINLGVLIHRSSIFLDMLHKTKKDDVDSEEEDDYDEIYDYC